MNTNQKSPSDKRAQVEHSFTYHAPRPEQLPKYTRIRELALAFALELLDLTPESREQSLAITHLEDCVMSANKAIALHS